MTVTLIRITALTDLSRASTAITALGRIFTVGVGVGVAMAGIEPPIGR
ncbi:MAG: hypothetical protein QX203_00975 [Methylococcaceae bacterium]